MRLHFGHFTAGLAILALAAPVFARPRTESIPFDLTQPATIAGTELKAGSYQIRAVENESKLDVLHDGKVVAQVPCHWIQLPNKALNSEVVFNERQITEVDFGGKTEAIQIGG
jgi:hypothetical protein